MRYGGRMASSSPAQRCHLFKIVCVDHERGVLVALPPDAFFGREEIDLLHGIDETLEVQLVGRVVIEEHFLADARQPLVESLWLKA